MYGRINTKANRLDDLKYQFDSLEKQGYVKEIYKDLNIFVKNEDKKFKLNVFRGTATKNINKYYYSSEDRRKEVIDNYKKSADYREQRKKDEKGNKKLSSHAATAKAIREELKKHFPGVSFSVTSESFSMGDSVRINWNDGPKTKDVEKYSGKYQQGHFDGMIDMYEYSNSREDIPQTKYVQESRQMSKETESILMPFIQEIFKNDKWGCWDAQNLLYQLFCQTSFPLGAKPTGIKRNDVESGICEIWNFYVITFDTDKEPEPEKPEEETEFIDFTELLIADEQE